MDVIKEGDILRINVCLKIMIFLFYCYLELLKYLVECIDYI